MIAWIKHRISLVCANGGFASHKDVLSFAAKVTLWVVIVADILNVVAHASLNAAGLLPYPVVPAATVGVVITTVLASTLTFSITYIIGFAIHDLSISRNTFEQLSRTDMLSGLLNRRAFLEAIAVAPDEASLVLFDIDRFKSINDRYGHDAGDRVIVSVAQTLTGLFGSAHVAARIGGEEFAVLISGLMAAERLALADFARISIAQSAIKLDDNMISATVSGGVAEKTHHLTFGTLFAAADRALYVAKASGRNLVLHECNVPQGYMRSQKTNDPDASAEYVLSDVPRRA